MALNLQVCTYCALHQKKDGAMCICIDFCNLNVNTHVDKYPILCIGNLLDWLHGALVFSKTDLRAGYY